jgi:NitT/TauT family transport system permease protein
VSVVPQRVRAGIQPLATAGSGAAVLRRVTPVLCLIAALGFWELMSRIYGLPSWLLPAPSDIVEKSYAFRNEFPRHLISTFTATVIGFAIATVAGIGLGLAIASVRLLEQTVYPALVALQSVPKVALAPLFLMWIGYGMTMKVVVVFLVAVFPIVVSTTTGLKAVPETLVQMVRAFKATPLVELLQIRLPYSVPYVFVGLRVGISLAATGAVIGEFVGSSSGLGYLITVATQQFNTSIAFAAIVLLALLSVGLYYLIDLVQRLLFPWSLRSQPAGKGTV